MKNLEAIRVFSSDVTDAGLNHLKGLTKLRTLVYQNSYCADRRGAQGRRQLHQARRPRPAPRRGHVSDEGLDAIRGLTHLTRLALRGVTITGARPEQPPRA